MNNVQSYTKPMPNPRTQRFGNPVRWSQTDQRKDFDNIVYAFERWKDKHASTGLEMDEAIEDIDGALVKLSELMEGRL
jgi:hypothetical protein